MAPMLHPLVAIGLQSGYADHARHRCASHWREVSPKALRGLFWIARRDNVHGVVVGSPSQYTSAIHILEAIQDAFDMACQESRAARVVSIDRRGTRNTLAVQIIAAAIEGGERDPERLKAYALRGLNRVS